jgi:hypothetical protein
VAYYNGWSTSLSTATTITTATGVLFQGPGQVLHSVHTSANAGLVSAGFVQDNSACTCISWSSNAYWRGGKPRTYLPGVQTQYVANPYTISAGGDTWYTQKANDFHVAVNALNATSITNTQHGFVHFFQNGVLLSPSVFYPITGGQLHPRFGTQRRRLGRWQP